MSWTPESTPLSKTEQAQTARFTALLDQGNAASALRVESTKGLRRVSQMRAFAGHTSSALAARPQLGGSPAGIQLVGATMQSKVVSLGFSRGFLL